MTFEDDQHDMYVAYYSKMQEVAVNRNADEFQLMALRQALDMHRMYAARRQDVINPAAMGGIVPGVGAGPGEVDNNMLAALATGQTPQAMPQGGIDQPTY